MGGSFSRYKGFARPRASVFPSFAQSDGLYTDPIRDAVPDLASLLNSSTAKGPRQSQLTWHSLGRTEILESSRGRWPEVQFSGSQASGPITVQSEGPEVWSEDA